MILMNREVEESFIRSVFMLYVVYAADVCAMNSLYTQRLCVATLELKHWAGRQEISV